MEASGSKKDKISPNEDSSMLKPARARVWRACEVCRKRKVKCDGNDPCSYCISCGKECSFKESNDNASSSRQHAVSLDNRITKVEDTLRKLLPMAHAFEAWSRSNPSGLGGPFIVPDMNFEPGVPPPPRKETQTHAKRIPYKPSKSLQQMIRKMSSSSGVVSTPATPLELEPQEKFSDRFSQLTKDSHGNLRYVGGASSYMLIEALASLQEGSGTGDDHAYKAVPFVTHHEQFRSLKSLPKPEDVTYPSSELADQLVQVYFESIHHTFPILQQQLFLDRYVSTMQKVHLGTPSKDPVYLACLFAVFACGSLFLPKTIRHSVTEFEGLEYYERAQIMLLHNSSSSYIEHVQCLALLSLCSASWNTLAQSWLYAGQAVRRAQDLGLHRSTRFTMTRLEKELRCRVWWCVYGLDRVLSISLGRPLATHDDDCTVEYPAEIDDSDLLSWSEDGDNLSGDSYMTGFFALLKIYKVAGRIARVVQSSRLDDPDSQEAQTILSSLDQDLAQWIDELPDKIRFAEKGTSNPRLLSLSISAFFVYYASIIILHRPFAPDPPNTQTHLRSLAACLTAARSCIRIGALAKAVLPTSHHLAFAVQFITLSAILLVRSVHYVNQVELVEAILTDVSKAVDILDGLQESWSGATRCKEIVQGLLNLMRTRSDTVDGTPNVAQPLTVDGKARGKKRKATEDGNSREPSRPRLLNGGTATGFDPAGMHGRIDSFLQTGGLDQPPSSPFQFTPSRSSDAYACGLDFTSGSSLDNLFMRDDVPMPVDLSNAKATDGLPDFLSSDFFALLGSAAQQSESRQNYEQNAEVLSGVLSSLGDPQNDHGIFFGLDAR